MLHSESDGCVAIEQFSAVKQREDRTGVPGYLGFSVSVSTRADAATVRIAGDLDCYTAPQLRAALLALVDEGARQVTLDVAGTQFVDSTGLSVLVGGLKRLRDQGGNMVVRSPNDTTRRLFEITGLSTVFDIT
jgi:anti-sigma B factor antagonist